LQKKRDELEGSFQGRERVLPAGVGRDDRSTGRVHRGEPRAVDQREPEAVLSDEAAAGLKNVIEEFFLVLCVVALHVFLVVVVSTPFSAASAT
jgi:hypothetical protein